MLSVYESNKYILNWLNTHMSPFKGVSNTKPFFCFEHLENLTNPVKQSEHLKHICYYLYLTLASTHLKPNQLYLNQVPSFPATISWSHYCQLHKLHPYLYLGKPFLFCFHLWNKHGQPFSGKRSHHLGLSSNTVSVTNT